MNLARTIIRFVEDVRTRIYHAGNKSIAHTFKKGQKVHVNIGPCEVNPNPHRVDIELASGNMIYHVPTNSFQIVAGIRS